MSIKDFIAGGAKQDRSFKDVQNPVLEKETSRLEIINEQSSNEVSDIISSLEVLSAINPIVEDKEKFNFIVLSAGEYGGATLEKENTTIIGISNSKINRLVTIRANATISGVHFISSDKTSNNKNHLLKVTNSSSLVLNNCIFEKGKNDPMSSTVSDEKAYIINDVGCAVILNSCTFTGSVTGSGFVIVNRDTSTGSAIISNCRNLTGRPHSNVFVISEIFV